MTVENLAEIRNWVILILGTVGAIVTIKTFIDNTRQRKLDNTYKTLEYLRKHISKDQIETFVSLFHANNPIGVPENEFHLDNGRKDYIETMFSEGGCGNGDVQNMIEVFNLVSKSLNKGIFEENLIWYEYGQIMETCYRWTKYLEDNIDGQVDLRRREGMSDGDYKLFLKEWKGQLEGMISFFFDFNLYMKNATKRFLDRPTKHYTYAE
ncbi:MAG: hypothetical protein IPP77_08525 [Bacteroidetes bacterium]|nr:hypothetical protein [Bacteroidota bacterium]